MVFLFCSGLPALRHGRHASHDGGRSWLYEGRRHPPPTRRQPPPEGARRTHRSRLGAHLRTFRDLQPPGIAPVSVTSRYSSSLPVVLFLARVFVFLLCSAVSEVVELQSSDVSLLQRDDVTSMSESDRALLESYQHSFDDAKVDLDLVLCLLHTIHSSKREGRPISYLRPLPHPFSLF